MSQQVYYFAGGGTGGHLFPGLAVAGVIRAREPASRIVFLGSERSLESTLVTRHGFDHLGLPAQPLTLLKRNPFAFLWRNWRALRVAQRLLKQDRPTAVIGLGGFASAPVVLAANRLGVPSLLLEQNSIPGRSTRWLSRWADAVCLSYPESAKYFSKRVTTHLTGNPVREQIVQLARNSPLPDELDLKPRNLLILGGSQGAQSLNEGMLWLLQNNPGAMAGWQIVHQTGTAQQPAIEARYRDLGISAEVSAFLPDMAERYAAATLVISRAGATTLAELACAGLPAILTPYPFATDNHQWHNARTFEVAGAALIASQGDSEQATGKILMERLNQLLNASDCLQVMSHAMRGLAKPDATVSVLQVLSQLIAK